MRIRISDGTHEVEITAKGYSRSRLDAAESAALRMLDALRDEQPTRHGTSFGFTVDVALDSSSERAEPYDDGRRHEDDEQ